MVWGRRPTITDTFDLSTNTPAKSNSTKPARVGLTLIATSLGSPTAIVSTPDQSDQRLFVVDRAGLIKIIGDGGKVKSKPFLDIRSKVQAGGEMGLLGLAFHPSYKTNSQFFVNYTDKDQNTIVARFKASTDPNRADAASEEILLKVAQPYRNHNGGDMAFGPDKYLYIALGDGGSGGDPQNRAQNMNVLFGKILRIDVSKEKGYSIPTDNPFVKEPNAKPEIWSYGLRNPWRFSFDKETGDMWIGDVGQGKVEEVNFEKAGSPGGVNYGWRCYEGAPPYNPLGCKEKSQYTFPVLEYTHEERRCSVTGGFVYRGSLYKSLAGKYFYGDYCTGEVFMAEQKDGEWQSSLAIDTPYKISTFGQSSSGELYLADLETGSVYLIQDIAN